MQRLTLATLAALALAGTPHAEARELKPPPRRSTDLPPPRDGDVAVHEELDAARRAGTLPAYDLFIARHGGHPLADVARRERALLMLSRP